MDNAMLINYADEIALAKMDIVKARRDIELNARFGDRRGVFKAQRHLRDAKERLSIYNYMKGIEEHESSRNS